MIQKIYVIVKRDKDTGEFISVCASYRWLQDAVKQIDELNLISDSYIYSYAESNLVLGV